MHMRTQSYSQSEEMVHSSTALFGVVAMVLGTPWMISTAARNDQAWQVVGVLAFCLSALSMFVTSTLYHFVRAPHAKAMLRRLDHSAIYILIAGTYTPFMIGVVGGPLGWWLLVTVWSVAILGVAMKMWGALLHIPILSTVLYLILGWIGMIAARQLWGGLSVNQFGWLVAGGLCYTAGVPFYLWKRRSYAHGAWHLFVLGGVACHFMAIRALIMR
jgi:hemolysin III